MLPEDSREGQGSGFGRKPVDVQQLLRPASELAEAGTTIVGKAAKQRLDETTARRGRNSLPVREPAIGAIAPITREELVGTIPRQRHGHLLSRRASQEVAGEQRGIRQGLVDGGEDAGRPAHHVFSRHRNLTVAGSESSCRRPRVAALVEGRRFGEAHRVAAQIGVFADGEGGHQTGIEPAGEEASHRNVASQPQADGIDESCVEGLTPARRRRGRRADGRQVPPPRDPRSPLRPLQERARFELRHALENGLRGGHESEVEIG